MESHLYSIYFNLKDSLIPVLLALLITLTTFLAALCLRYHFRRYSRQAVATCGQVREELSQIRTVRSDTNAKDDNKKLHQLWLMTENLKPGKPKILRVSCENVELEWTKPEQGAHNITSYTIFYRSTKDPPDRWMQQKTSNAEEKIILSQLSEGKTYLFKVRPESKSGESGPESDESEPIQTKIIIPSKPGKPIATNITHNTIELEWSKPEQGAHNVTSYAVFYCSDRGPDEQWIYHRKVGFVDKTTLSNLSEKTTYYFKVQAKSMKDHETESDASEPITTKMIIPSKPGKPIPINITHNSIQVKWNKPEQGAHNIAVYTVLYRFTSDPPDQWLYQKTETAKETVSICQLQEGSSYVFKVRPECGEYDNSCSVSDESEFIATKIIVPSKPGKPSACHITQDSVELEWTKPEQGAHNVTSYTIFYCSTNDPRDQWMQQKTSNTEEKTLVSQLSENTTYLFKVRPESKSGKSGQESDKSEPIQTKMIIPGKPGTPKATNITHDTIELEWSKPELGAPSYTVFYCSDKGPDEQWIHKNVGFVDKTTLSDLSEKTTYYIKVQAKTMKDHETDSDISEPITTKMIIPSKPGKPIPINITHNSIQMKWTKPEQGAHNIAAYTVLYHSTSNPPDQWLHQKTETADETVSICQLQEGGSYVFKVRPECGKYDNSCSVSDESEFIATKLIVPSKPGKPSACHITHDSVELEWTKPEQGAHNVISYTIFYCSANDLPDQWLQQKTSDAEKKALVSQLSEKNTYLFKVRPESKSGESGQESDESEPIQTKMIIPSNPGKPKATNITHDTIELEWSKPELGAHNVASYTVVYRSSDGLWMCQKIGLVEKTTLSNLLERTVYYFKIQAKSEEGDESESDVSEPITTKMLIPSKPGKPIPINITHNSIQVKWTKPEQGPHNIAAYTVLYRTTSDPLDQWLHQKTKTAAETVSICQLQEGGSYVFKVRPECGEYDNSCSVSDESEFIVTKLIVPSKPGKPSACHITHNSVELEWTKPEQGAHNVTSYTIFYCSTNDLPDRWMQQKASDTERKTIVVQLSEKNTYLFKVRPESKSGESGQESDESEPIQTKMIIPSNPGKPKATNITHDTIELEWSKPELGAHNVASYTVVYRSSDGLWMCQKIGLVEKTTLSNLLERTVYYFKIQAKSEEGDESESDVSEPITTKMLIPSKPGKPIPINITHNSIQVKWTKPEQGPHNIAAYTVLYRTTSNPLDQWLHQKTKTAAETVSICQLQEGGSYVFKVRPECGEYDNSCSVSDESEFIVTKLIVPSKPGKPSACHITHDSVELEWTKPEQGAHNITSYTIFYCSTNDPRDQWMQQKTSDTERKILVAQLSERNTYLFKVRPESKSGESGPESDESEPIQTKMIIPSNPGKPKATNITHDTIELEWSKPELGAHNVTSYTILYRSFNDPLNNWSRSKPITLCEKATLCGLSEKTIYIAKVQVKCEDRVFGDSTVSEPIQTLLKLNDKNVVDKAWCAREKWYYIGLRLGFEKTDLNVIKLDEKKCDPCFIEMVSKWLRKGDATWKTLIDALNHKSVAFNHLAGDIEKDCGITKIRPHSPIEPTLAGESQMGFKCPCGKYSLENGIDRKCPNYDSSDFPYLKQEHLTENEKFNLYTKLIRETKKIEKDFIDLVHQTRKSLNSKQNINLQEISDRVEDMLPLSSPPMDSSEINSASAIIKHLRRKKYISFFNYRILQDLITNYGTEEDKKMLSEYEAKFKTFCERSVFEVPQAVFGPPPDSGKPLAFKVTDKIVHSLHPLASDTSPPSHHTVETSSKTLNLSLNDTFYIQDMIADRLDIEPARLIFLDAYKGCIALMFLVPNVTIDRVIQQRNVDKVTELPGITTLDTEGIHILCGPPSKPYAIDITSDGISLWWNKPEYQGLSQIQHYHIHYKSLNDTQSRWRTVRSIGFVETLYIGRLLQYQSPFIFRVQAVDAIGPGIQSEQSDPIHLRPSSVQPSNLIVNADKPGKPRALNITHDCIQLEWTKPEKGSGNITSYTVLYRSMEDPPNQWMEIRDASTEERVSISQLSENTTYFFLVQPEFGDGIGLESDISDPIPTKKIISSKPGKPSAIKVSHDSIELEWTKPERGAHNVISYTVLCHSASDPADYWREHKAMTTKERIVISQLNENTTYYFKIQPQCADGDGLQSDVSDPISTNMIIPSQPGKPQCKGVSHNSIQIEWTKPEQGAHNVTSYSILY